jgi:hypothetical protein
MMVETILPRPLPSPTGRMVGKVSLEIPVSAANPSLKQRQRGKAVRQANNGNSAGQPGARDKARADCQGAFRWRSRDLIRLRQLFVECAPKAGAV